MVNALAPGDPQQVGEYRLLGALGSGGMGRVFLGQPPGGRLVAVKLIRTELAGNPSFRARFAREVATARTVGGIFTVPVVDADTSGPQPWLATGYVDGPSLAAAIARYSPLTHVLDRTFIVQPGHLGYALELYGPAAEWAPVYASMWNELVNSFEPAS